MTISFARHQFPPAIIRHAVWLYMRFTLSYRDVEDLLAERGLDISYETVRRWVLKFGPLFARELRRRRPRPTSRWHLDEMAVTVADRQFWLWRSVDDEGEVLDLLGQRRRDKAAAILASTSRNRRETLSRASPSMNSCRPLVTLLRPFGAREIIWLARFLLLTARTINRLFLVALSVARQAYAPTSLAATN